MEIFKASYLERLFKVNGGTTTYRYRVYDKNPNKVKYMYPSIGYRFVDIVFGINEETEKVEVDYNYSPTVFYGDRYSQSECENESNDICVLSLDGKEIEINKTDKTEEEMEESQFKLRLLKKNNC